MIIVMDNGYAFVPVNDEAKETGRKWNNAFEEVLIKEVIPMIDSTYRTKSDKNNRAIAGLSMGANQTMRILMDHLDDFAYYGGFSGTSNYPSSDKINVDEFLGGKFKDGESLNNQIKVFWLGLGTNEPNPFPGSVGAFRDMLEKQDWNMYITNPRKHPMNG